MFDSNSEFDRRVRRRLREERICWLTTVDQKGRPQPRPVWFLWDGESFLIYSRPNTHKLRHIAANPQVAVHLDGDGQGGDIVVFAAEGGVDPAAPRADMVPAYAEKYAAGFERLEMTAAQFSELYSVALRLFPTRLRGH